MSPLIAGGLRSGEKWFVLVFAGIALSVLAARCHRLRTEQPDFLDTGNEAEMAENDDRHSVP